MEPSALKIRVISASGLEKAVDGTAGGASLYCVGVIAGKASTKFGTPVAAGADNPVWDNEHTVDGYSVGDDLQFSVFQQRAQEDKILGSVSVPSRDFFPRGCTKRFALAGARGGSVLIKITCAQMHSRGSQQQQQSESNMDMLPDMSHFPIASDAGGALGAWFASNAETFGSRTDTAEPVVRSRGLDEPAQGIIKPGENEQVRPTAKLKVTIVSARGLRQGGMFGFSKLDPYCVCDVPGMPHMRFETPVVSNNTNPTWNSEFLITEYPLGADLHFGVWDKEPWPKRDELLGAAVLPSGDFLRQGQAFAELRLASDKATARSGLSGPYDGVILYVGVEVLSFSEEHMPEAQLPVVESLGFQPPLRLRAPAPGKARLEVLIMGVRDAVRSPGSQSFCRIQVPGKPQLATRTRSIGDMPTASWYEKLTMDYSPGDSLQFSLHQVDQGQKESMVGKGSLLGADFYPNGCQVELELAEPQAGYQAGVLGIEIHILQHTSDHTKLQQQAHYSVLSQWRAHDVRDKATGRIPQQAARLASSDHAPQNFNVFIASAKCLESSTVSVGRKPNTYCVCDVPGRPNSRVASPVITQSGDPVWNFRAAVDLRMGEVLRFTVVAKGNDREDAILGKLEFTCSDLAANGCAGDFILHAGGAHATVRLKVSPEAAALQFPASPSSSVPAKLAMKTRSLDSHPALKTRSLDSHPAMRTRSLATETPSTPVQTEKRINDASPKSELQVAIERASTAVTCRPVTSIGHRKHLDSSTFVRVS